MINGQFLLAFVCRAGSFQLPKRRRKTPKHSYRWRKTVNDGRKTTKDTCVGSPWNRCIREARKMIQHIERDLPTKSTSTRTTLLILYFYSTTAEGIKTWSSLNDSVLAAFARRLSAVVNKPWSATSVSVGFIVCAVQGSAKLSRETSRSDVWWRWIHLAVPNVQPDGHPVATSSRRSTEENRHKERL